MDRVYQANAIETPPSTTPSSGSFPTAGNKASGQLATVPGPYWFYSITEEIRNALIAAGVTPDAAKVNQLAEAMSKFLPLSGGNVTGNLTVQSKNVVCSVNGSIADMAGNVSLAVGDGTVVEKINTTVNVKRGANAQSTVTISDLTPLKPLYVVLKRSDTLGSVRSFSFVSNGVALKTTSFSQEKDLSLGLVNARWHIVVPTGTSVALTVTGSYDDSLSYRVIAYQ